MGLSRRRSSAARPWFAKLTTNGLALAARPEPFGFAQGRPFRAPTPALPRCGRGGSPLVPSPPLRQGREPTCSLSPAAAGEGAHLFPLPRGGEGEGEGAESPREHRSPRGAAEAWLTPKAKRRFPSVAVIRPQILRPRLQNDEFRPPP